MGHFLGESTKLSRKPNLLHDDAVVNGQLNWTGADLDGRGGIWSENLGEPSGSKEEKSERRDAQTREGKDKKRERNDVMRKQET